MDKSEETGAMVAGAVLAFALPALLIYMVVVGGWALSILWGWFAVPVFSLPQITVAQAIGLQLVLGQLRGAQTARESKPGAFAWAVAAPFVALLIGWITKAFI